MNSARRFAAVFLYAAASGCAGIEGSGHVVGEARPAVAFHRLTLEGSADVQIARGAVAGITVFTDDNLLPYVETRLAGDELRIGERDPHCGAVALRPTDGIRVMVTVPEALTDITLSGSGSITYLGASSAESGTLRLGLSGSGSLDVEAAVGEIDLELSGSGGARFQGSASRADVAIFGSGSVDAFELPVTAARVALSGSGSARVFARESLDASVSGSGSVIFRGSPAVTRSVTGSGSVRHE